MTDYFSADGINKDILDGNNQHTALQKVFCHAPPYHHRNASGGVRGGGNGGVKGAGPGGVAGGGPGGVPGYACIL